MFEDERPDGLSDELLRLASRHGVVPDFWGFDGTHKWVAPETVVRVLAAMGVDASTPERIAVELDHAEDDVWRHTLPPVVVLRQGTSMQLPVHVDDGADLTVRLALEDGGEVHVPQVDVWTEPRTVDGRRVGRATVELPDHLPLGWHTAPWW